MYYVYIIAELLFSGLFFGFSCAFVSFVISPLQFLKVMKQSSNNGYYKILLTHFRKGGVLIFFRGALPYAMMNLYSSMSFGFSERASALLGFMQFSLFWSSVSRSLLGALFETIISLYAEIMEIAKNKGVEVDAKKEYIKLFLPILIRNSIFWNSAIVAYELNVIYHFSVLASFCLSLFLGMIFGAISIPFDVIATRICANSQKIGGINGIIVFFKSSIKKNNASHSVSGSVFDGLTIRLVQVVIFSFTTALTIKQYDIFIQYLSNFL